MKASQDKIRKIIADQLGVKREEVSDNIEFTNDLGADSLGAVELVVSLEQAFSVEIANEDIEKLKTVGDMLKYIQEKCGT